LILLRIFPRFFDRAELLELLELSDAPDDEELPEGGDEFPDDPELLEGVLDLLFFFFL